MANDYIQSTTAFIEGLTALIKNITLLKFVKWLIVIILIGGVVVLTYDVFLTSKSYYDKSDRKLDIIKRVQELSNGDSVIIAKTHVKLNEILDNLDEPIAKRYLINENVTSFLSGSTWQIISKILSAFSFPILILLISDSSRTDRKSTITGGILLIIVFGIIAPFIPTIYSLWLNFFLTPILQLIALLPFMLRK